MGTSTRLNTGSNASVSSLVLDSGSNASVSSLVLDSVFAGSLAPLFFVLALLLFLGIIAVNVFLVAVIATHTSLHAPVYVFMCSLFVNGLVGGSSLLPFLLPQLSNLTHRVSLTSCGLQMFLMYTYSSVEFFNLAAMAYDRYVAICFPLSYRQRLCPRAVGMVLALVWGSSLILGAFVATLVTLVKFCESRIHKIYCNYYDLGSLVCVDDSFVGPTIKVLELLYMSTALLGMVVFIVFTYVRILVVCFRGFRQTRQKAVSTCVPHLASLTNYGLSVFLEESQTKFDIQNISRVFQVFLSLYIVIGPPLLNALLYGLNMSQLRAVCKRLLAPKKI